MKDNYSDEKKTKARRGGLASFTRPKNKLPFRSVLLILILVIALAAAACDTNDTTGTGSGTGTGSTVTASTQSGGTTTRETTQPTVTATTSTTTQTTGTTSTATTAATTVVPTTTQTAATTQPTTTRPPVTQPTTKATTKATTKPATSTTKATTATTKTSTTAPATDLTKLSAATAGWYYNRPAAADLFKDKRVTIPGSVASLIAPWSVIWQAKPTGRKTVYLTMDEGYEFEKNTSEILATAAAKKVHIAFFITGTYLRNQPELVKRMVAEGHLVLNHTNTHPNLGNLYREQGAETVMANITQLELEFKALTGKSMPKYLRPPEGAYSERLLGLLDQHGYRTVFWSFAYRDWLTNEQPTLEAARRTILGELHDGSVILLHAVSNTNVALLPELIEEIRARGYSFGRLTDIPG